MAVKRKAPKPAPKVEWTCSGCKFAHANDAGTLICYRNPPQAVVIGIEARTMRVSVQPTDRACGEYRSRA